jgi:hypothetical protein
MGLMRRCRAAPSPRRCFAAPTLSPSTRSLLRFFARICSASERVGCGVCVLSACHIVRTFRAAHLSQALWKSRPKVQHHVCRGGEVAARWAAGEGAARQRRMIWDIATRYPRHRDAIPTTSRRDTHDIATRHPRHRDATPSTSRRDTHDIAARHLRHRDATPTLSRRDTQGLV